MYPHREGLTITLEYRELGKKYVVAPFFLEESFTYRESPPVHLKAGSHISMEMIDIDNRDFHKLVAYTAEKAWRDIERKLVDEGN